MSPREVIAREPSQKLQVTDLKVVSCPPLTGEREKKKIKEQGKLQTIQD